VVAAAVSADEGLVVRRCRKLADRIRPEVALGKEHRVFPPYCRLRSMGFVCVRRFLLFYRFGLPLLLRLLGVSDSQRVLVGVGWTKKERNVASGLPVILHIVIRNRTIKIIVVPLFHDTWGV